jgi:hypothetical protein
MTRKSDSAPESAAGFKSRRSTRVDVSDIQLSLLPQHLYKVAIQVQNVSASGFMAQCAAPVRIGSYVTLDIPGIGPVEAQVRWQLGLRMGGMFLDPIRLGSCEWTAEEAKAGEPA